MAASIDAAVSLQALGLTPEQQQWVKDRVRLVSSCAWELCVLLKYGSLPKVNTDAR